jgi:crotonobetainyl-CoA:carnitine CoA-transferase CaiB-like acyl-CoA transferase
MFSLLDHPGIGAYLTPGNPITFSGVERIAPSRAPSLGENTDEILGEIGYSEGEIAALHDAKIVAGPPL